MRGARGLGGGASAGSDVLAQRPVAEAGSPQAIARVGAVVMRAHSTDRKEPRVRSGDHVRDSRGQAQGPDIRAVTPAAVAAAAAVPQDPATGSGAVDECELVKLDRIPRAIDP